MVEYSRRSFDFILMLLVFILIFDPTNKIFHAKELFFIILSFFFACFVFFKNESIEVNYEIILLVFLFSLIVPFYSFFMGVLTDINFSLEFALSQIKSLILFFTVIALVLVPNNFERYFIFTLIALAVFILFTYFGFLLEIKFVISYVSWLVTDIQAALIGPRSFGKFDITMVYYKTAPLLVFPVAYIFSKKINISTFFILFIVLAAFFVSGTRANMFVAILMFFLFVFLKVNYIFKLLFVAFFFSFLVVFLPGIVDNFLNPSEVSNTIKIQHIKSYFHYFLDNPILFVFGSGLGSGFYSSGVDEIVQQTELVYLDILRTHGVVFLLVVLFVLFYPFFKMLKLNHFKAFGYLFYLIIAGTNPLLFSSTGMLALVYAYYLVYFKVSDDNRL